MKNILLIIFILGCLHAEIQPSKKFDIVTVKTSPVVTIATGDSSAVQLTVSIQPGLHIQANPVNDQYLIPATVKINNAGELLVDAPLYPPGHSFILTSGDTLLVYEDTVVITLPVFAPQKVTSGQFDISGELRYQACDSVRCFIPRAVPFTIPVEIFTR